MWWNIIYRILTVLCTLYTAMSCSARENADRLRKAAGTDTLVRYWGELLHDGNFSEVRSSARNYYAYAEQNGDERLLMDAGIFLGQAYTEMPDSMQYYFNEVLPTVKKYNNRQYLLIIYNGNAIHATNALLDYNTALYWYQLALRVAYESDDMLNYCALLCNAVDLYYQKEDSSGTAYATEAYRISKELDNDYLRFYSTLGIAKMSHVCGDYERSLEYLDGITGEDTSHLSVLSLYARNWLAIGDTASAEKYYMTIFSHDTPFPTNSILDAYLHYGRLLYGTGRYHAAISYYQEGIRQSEKIHNLRSLVALYEGLADAYGGDGQAALSSEYRSKASVMRDTLQTVDKERQFGLMRIRYHDAINDINAQRKDFELKEMRMVLVFSAVLFVVIMAAVLLYFRKKREGYKDLVRQYENRRQEVRRLTEDNARLSSRLDELASGLRDPVRTQAGDKEAQRSEDLFSRLEKAMTEDRIWQDKELSLDSVARTLCTNVKYVSKCLEHAGTSFYTYINKYRINEAIRLLSIPDNDMPMRAVADMVGYNSVTSFYRVFQKETGVPPKYYREELLARNGASQ